MPEPHRYHALIYDYPADLLERRAPHRPGHLALLETWTADGRLVMAGALGEPPTRGLLIFDVEDPAEIDAFLAADPYKTEGVASSHRVEPWLVVASR